ncbi:hypothetical protein [Accumulibacter sp.]|uniref:hypothetical protein n=1 Tax=Accumulibacter sp. TaxID=2053492 RepID=UPI0026352DE4|nr:hypothetical protein [Accumulibacter sp.]
MKAQNGTAKAEGAAVSSSSLSADVHQQHHPAAEFPKLSQNPAASVAQPELTAAPQAAVELVHEARLKAQRAQLQVIKTAQLLDFVRGGDSIEAGFERLGSHIAFDVGSKCGITSVEKEAIAEGRRMVGKLVADPEYTQLMTSPGGRELFNETTKRPGSASTGLAATSDTWETGLFPSTTARCALPSPARRSG